MPIQHAVLSLLDGKPSHGYQLKAAFENAIGPQWGPLNIGHLYQTLERLSRDGYVTSQRQANATRPDRRVYTLTSAGRAELRSWLAQPAERATGYRDELFFKLLAAVRDGPERLRTVLTQQRAYQLGQLRTLGDLRTAHAGRPLVALLIDAARLHAEADLRLLDLAEEQIADLTRSQPSATANPPGKEPTETHRRGR